MSETIFMMLATIAGVLISAIWLFAMWGYYHSQKALFEI